MPMRAMRAEIKKIPNSIVALASSESLIFDSVDSDMLDDTSHEWQWIHVSIRKIAIYHSKFPRKCDNWQQNNPRENISGIYAKSCIFDNSKEHEICYLVSTHTNGCLKDEMNMLLKDFSKKIFRKKAESALLCKSKKGFKGVHFNDFNLLLCLLYGKF